MGLSENNAESSILWRHDEKNLEHLALWGSKDKNIFVEHRTVDCVGDCQLCGVCCHAEYLVDIRDSGWLDCCGCGRVFD